MNEPSLLGKAAIDLAHEASFVLGDLHVSPSTREVSRGDAREVLEPRVLQVLVALHQANGTVVSRDDLIARCWEGRIVGEDAINRAIGRLRRLATTGGAPAFEIETIARVGYRLTPLAAPAERRKVPGRLTLDRRVLMAGGGALAIAGAGAAYGLWALRAEPSPEVAPPRVSSDIRLLLQRAGEAQREGSPEGNARAIGLLETVVQRAPGLADGWSGLALAYAFAAHGGPPAQSPAMRLRSAAAINRARAIDPHNAIAYEAQAWLFPRRGAWLQTERTYREGLRYHPRNDGLLLGLGLCLGGAGRNAEAADLTEKAIAVAPQMDPALAWNEIQSLYFAGRLVEADEAANRNIALFPRQSSVWFSRLGLLTFTGRTVDALAMLGDVDGRPPGVPEDEFDSLAVLARAVASKDKADIANVVADQMARARLGSGYAENAIIACSGLGAIDQAFAVAEALYFNRGFTVGLLRFSRVQGGYTHLEDRRTRPLFAPVTGPMRADPRFAGLVDELGLTAYWRQSGVKPDYQRA